MKAYRWRSEGYATSSIGDFGMVGTELSGLSVQFEPKGLANPATLPLTIALWGDSQAEGVCVDDADKIFSLASKALGLTVLPLARSGDNASDWIEQIGFVEQELGGVAHVFLIAELSDLAAAVDPPKIESSNPAANSAITWLPDFVIQGARNLLTGDDGVSIRQLRFSLGPAKKVPAKQSQPHPIAKAVPIDWDVVLGSIQAATDRRIVILYAPQIPQVLGDRIASQDADQDSFTKLTKAASSTPIQIVDLRDRLIASADQGNWPHGFHNGRIGSGHLNEIGNQIIADALVDAIQNEDR